MRRAIKINDSEIVTKNLKYPKSAKAIREILEREQNGFCAYTEYRINAGFSVDVEHFNPTLKGTQNDGYENWYVVSHKFNNEKSNKWTNFQPILHPTAKDFSKRIIYDKDDALYICNPKDKEAQNLINLLDLNNERLINDRKKWINSLRDLFAESQATDFQYWITHPESKRQLIQFPRAIETTFNIHLKILN